MKVPYDLKNKVEKIYKAEKLNFLTTQLFDTKTKKRNIAEDLLIFVNGKSDFQIIYKWGLLKIELNKILKVSKTKTTNQITHKYINFCYKFGCFVCFPYLCVK